jgi:uncharacterized membrane protein
MKNLLLKIKDKLKNLIPSRRLNPHIYWNSLLSGFFVVIIFLIIFSFYILYRIKNKETFQITPASEGTYNLVNETLFKKVNTFFENKEIRIKEIENGVKTYQDPSLK